MQTSAGGVNIKILVLLYLFIYHMNVSDIFLYIICILVICDHYKI
jgi:hypothetical protein